MRVHDSWERFEEEALPEKDAFYSKLKMEHINDEDYKHAHEVCNAFECKTLGDYHNLYLKTDVLLLADVFENFRETCFENYNLDPAHYYTSPGLSWDSLLKHASINLELLTDINMHLFIEKGMRGGISMESRRFCKANNPYLEDYDPDQEPSYITYLDANILLRLGFESTASRWQLLLVLGVSDTTPNHEVEAKQKDWLYSRGWSRIPRGASR